jgi:hypothetical protein
MPGLEGTRGDNVNGPSLVRLPECIPSPLGRYYLYFAHHHGQEIRLAYADRLEGPWTVRPEGVLHLADTAAHDHIASPDVHVDEARCELSLYFHGVAAADDRSHQLTYLARSADGLSFAAGREPLAPFYLRVFEHRGVAYGLAKRGNEGGILLRSPDGASPFEPGPEVLPGMRHAAVLPRGDEAWIFFSRIGDAPERLLFSRLGLAGDWRTWRPGSPVAVLAPERPWEGVSEPLVASVPGAARGRRRELRDPAVFVEEGRVYLLYAVAGESGIALAELEPAAPFAPSRPARPAGRAVAGFRAPSRGRASTARSRARAGRVEGRRPRR